jgi:Fe-S cluster biogenesis protein NfuA/nitrite reductase/ring-hydroxylating ferredoxin subunit
VPVSNTSDIQAVGEKVEALLAEFASASDPTIAGRAEELVGLLVDFYGAGLARILELLDQQAAAPLLADKAVAGLLVLHDLHPQSTEERVLAALDRVRPYLGSHAGGVEYLGLDDDGTVRLRLAGSCDGCPSSALTVKMAIEKGIEDVAPEVTKVEVEGMVPDPASQQAAGPADGRPLLPLQQVSKQPEPVTSTWVQVDGVKDIGQGQVVPMLVADTAAVVCNVAGSLYAYADRCPVCGSGLADGKLVGALLGCPGCSQRYDVVRAGRGWDEANEAVTSSTAETHLDPLPLLAENGGVRIAVPAQAVS